MDSEDLKEKAIWAAKKLFKLAVFLLKLFFKIIEIIVKIIFGIIDGMLYTSPQQQRENEIRRQAELEEEGRIAARRNSRRGWF